MGLGHTEELDAPGLNERLYIQYDLLKSSARVVRELTCLKRMVLVRRFGVGLGAEWVELGSFSVSAFGPIFQDTNFGGARDTFLKSFQEIK